MKITFSKEITDFDIFHKVIIEGMAYINCIITYRVPPTRSFFLKEGFIQDIDLKSETLCLWLENQTMERIPLKDIETIEVQ